MLTLLQLLLPEIASHQGVAALIHDMPEVLAGNTNA
jgi:5'-deoxynucleotidase YfbR-like HD superfamily hydrolase